MSGRSASRADVGRHLTGAPGAACRRPGVTRLPAPRGRRQEAA
jgi:hypothetical protein